MKLNFTLILILCAFTITTQAQIITVDALHTVENFEDQDLSDNALDLEAHIAVTNNTSDQLSLVWNRIVTADCPDGWDTQICDNNLCYFYTIDSNVDDEIGLDAPFYLAANETFGDFILHVLPRGIPGCCRVKVEFSTVEDPDEIIETAIFDVSVNTPNCDFSTSTKEIAEAQLVTVFPNPTTDAFTLSNNDVVKQVELYNTLGQKLKSFDFENGEYLDISELDSGIYSLVLKNSKGEALHSLMLDKI